MHTCSKDFIPFILESITTKIQRVPILPNLHNAYHILQSDILIDLYSYISILILNIWQSYCYLYTGFHYVVRFFIFIFMFISNITNSTSHTITWKLDWYFNYNAFVFYLGVWSKRAIAIEKNKIYGPFVGEKKKLSSVSDHAFAWEVRIVLAYEIWNCVIAPSSNYSTGRSKKKVSHEEKKSDHFSNKSVFDLLARLVLHRIHFIPWHLRYCLLFTTVQNPPWPLFIFYWICWIKLLY